MADVDTLTVYASKGYGNIASSANHILLPSNNNKTQMKLCSVENPEAKQELLGQTSTINYLCFNNTGNMFATACRNIIQVWYITHHNEDYSVELTSSQLAKNLGSVTYMAFSKKAILPPIFD